MQLSACTPSPCTYTLWKATDFSDDVFFLYFRNLNIIKFTMFFILLVRLWKNRYRYGTVIGSTFELKNVFIIILKLLKLVHGLSSWRFAKVCYIDIKN